MIDLWFVSIPYVWQYLCLPDYDNSGRLALCYEELGSCLFDSVVHNLFLGQNSMNTDDQGKG